MRLATWNVNSLRSRLDRVVEWLQTSGTDVCALQETKVPDAKFPVMAFEAAGYEVAFHGLNQWNGVAVVSRVGIDDVQLGFDGCPGFGDPLATEARAIGATCGGVRLWSLYVPNGRTVDDPHYAYKLEWLAALRRAASTWDAEHPGRPLALVGDWNIAPTDDDVWDPAVFVGSTHVTEPERAALRAFLDDGFTDVVLPRTGPGVFSYWDYQQLAFPKKRGMRIDLVLGNDAFTEKVTGAFVDREQRKPKGSSTGQGPSDHAPVVVDLDIAPDLPGAGA
ncbi:exodeoxyribonuclease III [Aquipuribacter nitratireducens]|uniref:Exodeoxyribonuclease III n=1 Tax=Aquipuribacter nitratireducens TaxID=650104 RepID=A0ABW0GP30_9MICO